MEEYQDIIDALKKQKTIEPPAELTCQVMAKLEKCSDKTIAYGKIPSFRERWQRAMSSGRITSYEQCALLLFLIGCFYLMAGITAVIRLHETIGFGQFSLWLKAQPFIPAASGLIMLAAAFLIVYRPKLASVIQSVLMIHVAFLFVNAIILENMLVAIPVALVYVLGLTIMAIFLGILLIGSIRSALKIQMTSNGESCAKTA